MVDPATGYVYETEDRICAASTSSYPTAAETCTLAVGSYMLRVKNEPNADLGVTYPIGTSWKVDWVRIDDPPCAGPNRATSREWRKAPRPSGGLKAHGGEIARDTSSRPTAARRSFQAQVRPRAKGRSSNTTPEASG